MTMSPTELEELRRRYVSDLVHTATPAQRLMMLFDHLLRDLGFALNGFENGDLKEINDRLVHAQEIIAALRDPLDVTSDLGRSLAAVYTFCLSQLVRANFEKDRSLVPPVVSMIERIAQANRAVLSAHLDALANVG